MEEYRQPVIEVIIFDKKIYSTVTTSTGTGTDDEGEEM